MFELLAVVNIGIATAYVVIGAVIIPQLRLRALAMFFGVGFFLTCAVTHVELAAHTVAERSEWLVSWHMVGIHVAQLVVDWGFILAMAPWRGRSRSRLARQIESFLSSSGSTVTAEERRLVDAVLRSGTTHDVTLEEMHAAIEGFAEQKRLEQRKAEFVAFASHELRTPASVIYGAAQTLDARWDELPAEQRRELVEALAAHGGRLKRITGQLLDLSRYDTGNLRVEPQPVALEPVLRRIVNGAAELRVADGVAAYADEHALERVVGNLVANARRYGAEPITVTAAESDGSVVVGVEDRGDGVPEDFVPSLFARFARGDAQRHPDGAGLGLAIAAAYADALGGELRYAHAEPHGARFELVLRAAGATPAAPAEVPATA